MSNPYEAPESDFDPVSSDVDSEMRVDGKLIVVQTGVELPMRCFQCNAECGENDKRIKALLYYNPKWVYLLVLINVLVMIIVYFITRKPVKINYSQCSNHARRRFNEMVICVLSFVFSIGIGFAGLANELPFLFIVAAAFFIIFIIFLIRVGKMLYPVKHKQGDFWLQGAGPEFLQSLEEEQPFLDCQKPFWGKGLWRHFF